MALAPLMQFHDNAQNVDGGDVMCQTVATISQLTGFPKTTKQVGLDSKKFLSASFSIRLSTGLSSTAVGLEVEPVDILA